MEGRSKEQLKEAKRTCFRHQQVSKSIRILLKRTVQFNWSSNRCKNTQKKQWIWHEEESWEAKGRLFNRFRRTSLKSHGEWMNGYPPACLTQSQVKKVQSQICLMLDPENAHSKTTKCLHIWETNASNWLCGDVMMVESWYYRKLNLRY